MRGKWAQGIPPRNFAWIIKDRLAVSERPGGYARNHRKVRRQEEIIWLREQGFSRVVSLLGSSHNLHAYEELGLPYTHVPFDAEEPRVALPQLYTQLQGWLGAGEKLLLHQEELGDRVAGVMAGFLLWGGMLPTPPQAITIIEQILERPMGPIGRELVTVAATAR